MLTTVVAVVFMASSALAEVIDVIDNHGGRVDQYDARWRGVAARDAEVRVAHRRAHVGRRKRSLMEAT
jgi:hypothetical protein